MQLSNSRRGSTDQAALSRVAVAHPRLAIAAGLLVVIAAALGLPRLEIRTDGASLVPATHPLVEYDRAVRGAFDIRDQFIVMIRSGHPDGVYNPSTLNLVRDLTEEFTRIEGIDPGDLMSLATEHGDRVFPGTLTARTFLDPRPETIESCRQLRVDLERIRLYSGTLVSPDGAAAAIFVGVPAGARRPEVYSRLNAAIAEHRPLREQVTVVGGPVAETLLGTHLLDDLGVPEWITGPGVADADPDEAGAGASALVRLRHLIAATTGLLPVALLVMTFVLLFVFRRLAAALLPMIEAGLCLVFVFGLMGWFGVPVYLTIAVMPVILTAVGIADEIHIFHRYRALAGVAGDSINRVDVVRRTMDEMSRPVTRTSITTAIGFLSFAVSPIAPVQAFGLFTAIGVIFCMLFSLTVIPSCLVLMPVSSLVAPARSARRERRPLLQLLPSAAGGARRRLTIILSAVVVLGIAPFGIQRLTVQDSWIDGFSPESTFARATHDFNRDFLGVHVLRVIVDADAPVLSGTVEAEAAARDRLTLPADVIDTPERLVGAWIGVREPDLDGDGGTTIADDAPGADSTSATDATATAADHACVKAPIDRVESDGNRTVLYIDRRHGPLNLPRGADGPPRLRYVIAPRRFVRPETIRAVRDLERFIETKREDAVGGVLGPGNFVETTNYLVNGRREEYRSIPENVHLMSRVWDHFVRVRGAARLRNLVDDGFDRAVITVFLKDPNFRSTRHLMDSIRDYEQTTLAPAGLRLDFAGDVAVSQTLIEAIVTTQVRSLLLSLVGIFLVTAFLGRSIGWGLLCVLPCASAVAIVFAVMGFTGVPLGVATSMFAGMTLGIGVDYAIHLMERSRAARRASGLDRIESVADAVATTSPAILVDALALTAGFFVLLLSAVPANVRLGAILGVSVASCVLVTLLVLPALLVTWPPRGLR